jgi:hypothetical protein
VLHSGVVEDSKVYLLQELNKYPIAYIIGGPKDIAYNNVSFRIRYTGFRFPYFFHIKLFTHDHSLSVIGPPSLKTLLQSK